MGLSFHLELPRYPQLHMQAIASYSRQPFITDVDLVIVLVGLAATSLGVIIRLRRSARCTLEREEEHYGFRMTVSMTVRIQKLLHLYLVGIVGYDGMAG